MIDKAGGVAWKGFRIASVTITVLCLYMYREATIGTQLAVLYREMSLIQR